MPDDEKQDEPGGILPPFVIVVRLVDFGSLKGLVEIKMGDMTIRGFKVIQTPKGGRFISCPSREKKKPEGGGYDYYDFVRFESKEATAQFRRKILDAYDAEVKALEERNH